MAGEREEVGAESSRWSRQSPADCRVTDRLALPVCETGSEGASRNENPAMGGVVSRMAEAVQPYRG